MKHFLTMLLFVYCSLSSKSQNTIFPLESNEYCPKTEYTFTVNITKPFQSINRNERCNCYANTGTPGWFKLYI
mgnify:FL=1